MPDQLFKDAGAEIVQNAADAISQADVVLKVGRPSQEELQAMKPGAIFAGMIDPFGSRDGLEALASKGVSAFAMEFMPRITRAQSMDVLSSQSNLAGYKAVVDAAAHFGRALPMMMTAAGTVPAARIFVMGAGVAGLPPCGEGIGRKPWRQVHRGRGRRVQAGGNRRRLRERNVRRV